RGQEARAQAAEERRSANLSGHPDKGRAGAQASGSRNGLGQDYLAVAGNGLPTCHRRSRATGRRSVPGTEPFRPSQIPKRVTILDEDIPEDQYQLLRRWRLPARRIGVEVGRLGMK